MKNYNNLKNLGSFIDHCDGSIKSVYQSKDGIIEMTLINNKSYDVVCVPTHYFCNLGCKMCHLTNNRLNKCMVPINCDDFIEALLKSVCHQDCEKGFNRRTNKADLLISFMGVGEPLLNQNLIKAAFEKTDLLKKLLHYNNISFALATMFPNKDLFLNLIKMVNENNIPLKVHFSLHNPIDAKRFDLIPSSNINVYDALQLLKQYEQTISLNEKIMQNYKLFHRNLIPIEIHYTLIKNNNDNEIELNEIIALLKEFNIPIKFLTFNPKENMEISLNQQHWLDKISSAIPNINLKTYSPPGKQIGSSCGEFTKHYYHEEIESKEELDEFLNWQKKHIIKD